MKDVDYFLWWVVDPHRPKAKPYKTTFKMNAEAASKYPGAKPDVASREVRRVPETADEQLESMSKNATTPPRVLPKQ